LIFIDLIFYSEISTIENPYDQDFTDIEYLLTTPATEEMIEDCIPSDHFE
jgi:hypothetical protein